MSKLLNRQIGYVKPKRESASDKLNALVSETTTPKPKEYKNVESPKEAKIVEMDLAKWLLDHPFINKSALCKAAKLDRGNFDKYLKMGKFPKSAEKSLSEQLKAYGYGK